MTTEDETRRSFELLVMPHLNAAYNLARWLTHNEHDAEDVVHEAFIRAMRYMGGFRGENARPWLLQIVRHTCYSWLKENRPAANTEFDGIETAELAGPASDEPPAMAMRKAEREQIDLAIAALPISYREVLVLRELEELSYNDIARIADIPVGTVMSRLARARAMMREALTPGLRPVLRTVPRAAAMSGTKL
jgi:RNA polymerase sigma-70 factor (ECF subfamily)